MTDGVNMNLRDRCKLLKLDCVCGDQPRMLFVTEMPYGLRFMHDLSFRRIH